MKQALIIAFMMYGLMAIAQPTKSVEEKSTVGNAYQLREQTYGRYTPVDIRVYQWGADQLAVLQNGYVITDAEFLHAFRSTDRSDTSAAAKKKFLDTYVLSQQRVAEAMEQNLDTTTAFKLEFLKYKQDFITPYLNEGYTRLSAEALPEVKYALRAHYRGMILFELMTKEVWSKGTDQNLRSFYYDHLSLYQGQSYEVSKTKVVYDYNKQLETDLDARVTSKFPSKINADLLSKL